MLNPSFEVFPQAACWSTDAYLVDAADFSWEAPPNGHLGTRCISITASKFNDARWLQSVVGLVPGKTYWLSGWIKGENIVREPGRQVGANLCLFGTWDHTAPDLAGTFDWTRVIEQFTAPASGTITVGCRLGYWSNTASGKAWFDDIYLSDTDPSLNSPPVANPDHVERYANEGLKVAVATLLANDTDPNGDPLTLTDVISPTPNGAVVALNGHWIFYNPPPGFAADDSFSYLLTDGRGQTALGTVQVTLKAPIGETHNKLGIEDLHNGCLRVSFNAIPNRTYTVQVSLDLNTWNPVGQVTADVFGVCCFDDTALSGVRFYRTIYP